MEGGGDEMMATASRVEKHPPSNVFAESQNSEALKLLEDPEGGGNSGPSLDISALDDVTERAAKRATLSLLLDCACHTLPLSKRQKRV